MQSKTIKIFDWFDIRKEICKEMNIDEEHFRDYHKIIGGEYKDLWVEWLNYFEMDVRNDTITNNDLGEHMEAKLDWVIEDNKEWLKQFIEAVYKIWDKYQIEYIRYSW